MPRNLTPLARKLRKNQTPAEQKLWQALRRKSMSGHRFRRQVPLLGYIVDFACFDMRLIIEVDGATHSTDEEVAYDRRRDAALMAAGNTILRFGNGEIYENFDGVLETIWRKLEELRLRAPP